MAARGISQNWNTPGGVGTQTRLGHESFSVDLTTTSFTICGWMRHKGTAGGLRGHAPFHLSGGGLSGFISDFDGGTGPSWDQSLCVVDGVENQYALNTPDDDEDWFYVLQWNHTTATWIAYAALDEAGSVGSPVSSSGGRLNASITAIYVGGTSFNFNWGSNTEVTHVCGSTSLASAAELLAQMQNPNANVLPSPLFRWPMMDSTDLTDTVGSFDLSVISGSIGNGTMDPVDLQDLTPPPEFTPTLDGIQRLENGFGPAPAAGLQGVLAS